MNNQLELSDKWKASVEDIPETALKIPEVYYETDGKDYWSLNSRGEWIRLNETSLKRFLRRAGVSAYRPEGESLSPLDECLCKIQQERDIRYAGPLAGYPKGVNEVCGNRILVTTAPNIIQPRPGEYPLIRKLLDNMLGEEQTAYFRGLLKVGFESLVAGHRRPGQLLVLAGKRNSGKSLLQSILTEVYGGRVAKPYRYMSGATEFNRELFGAEHLAIEDENSSVDIRARRTFGTRIKEFTVDEVQSCHGKNREALSLTPWWRISLSVNDEPENLLILPPFDDSVADKIIALRVERHAMPMPTSSCEDRKKFREAITAELPAFLWDLTQFDIPLELRCERFGVKHFHHPAILEALENSAPETKLLTLIDALFQEGMLPKEGWQGTAELLQTVLVNSIHDFEAKRLLGWSGACGTYLGRLAGTYPDRVEDKRTSYERRWALKPRPATAEELERSPRLVSFHVPQP